MRISPESVQQSNEIIGMPCSVAAAHTGRPVALIGPRPGIDSDLWLLVWRPGDETPSHAMSAHWCPGSMISRHYECEECGELQVFGAQELLFMISEE